MNSSDFVTHYFTVSIPFAAGVPTEWHPTEATGPFSRLTRGSFPSASLAHKWAADHLKGTSYSVLEIEFCADITDEELTAFAQGADTTAALCAVQALKYRACKRRRMHAMRDRAYSVGPRRKS